MQFEADVAPERPQRAIATLEDYLEAMSQRKLLVVFCLLLGLGGAALLTKDRVPYYEASARVLLNPSPFGTTDGRLDTPNLEREASLIVGESLLDKARVAIGLPAGVTTGEAVTASYTPQSDALTVNVGSDDAKRSADLANQLIEVYVEQRVTEQSSFYTTNLTGIDAQITVLEASITDSQGQVEFLDQQAQALRNEPYSVDRDLQIGLLITQRNYIVQSITSDQVTIRQYQTQSGTLQRNRDGGKIAAARLTSATPPSSPSGVPTWAFYVAGGIAGLLLGVALAFLRHRLDRRAQSSREVEFALGATVIGSVPRFSWRFRRGTWGLVMAHDKRGASLGPVREAYRRLRGSVSFLARTTGSSVVVVTSSKPLEGKSTTSANLAVAIARGGATVALVSADLRRPSLERLLDVAPRRGLTDFLTGRTELVQTEVFPNIPNLTLLPAGPSLDNPGELFGGERFKRLVSKLRSDFDFVIIDTPPLKVAADAVAAAEQANGVIVVVDGNRTESPELVAIRRELDRAGVTLLGAVLNRDRSQKAKRLRRNRYGYYSDKKRSVVPTTADVVENDTSGGWLFADEPEPVARPRATDPRATDPTVTEPEATEPEMDVETEAETVPGGLRPVSRRPRTGPAEGRSNDANRRRRNPQP